MGWNKKCLCCLLGVVLALLFSAHAWAAPTAGVEGEADVVISHCEATCSTGAWAQAIPVGEDSLQMQARLDRPGAWASFSFTVENRGSAGAVLSDVLQTDETPEGIQVSFGISNADAGETLAPGERCTVSVVVQVDPQMTGARLETGGDFSLVLVYRASGEHSPATGDGFPLWPTIAMAGAGLSLPVLLWLRRREKRHEA